MSNLKENDRRKLEELLNMKSGYVLDFTDRTFGDFFRDYGINIDEKHYQQRGTSKAKRMRTFWIVDDNAVVGRVIRDLIKYGTDNQCFRDNDSSLIDECQTIADRLLSSAINETDTLTAISDERDFELLVEHIRDAIEKNQHEGGLDRLHTFVNKFIRTRCESYGITITKDKPLHSIFGEYVKALQEDGQIESMMTKRILKSSISIFEAFNNVRNDKSLAHDNPILNHEESLLIFNHVTASIRFIKSLDLRVKASHTIEKASQA